MIKVTEKVPIYVIGYPKPGNTWVARLLSDLLDSPIEAGDDAVNQADNDKEFRGDYSIVKGHYSRSSRPEYISNNSKIIYVVRDFRDVLISGFFFCHNNFPEKKILIKSNEFFSSFYKIYFYHQLRRMTKKWVSHELTVIRNYIYRSPKNTVGSWSDHVKYWTAQPNISVVRYEDLLHNPIESIDGILSGIDVTHHHASIGETIERQSFSNRKDNFLRSDDEVNHKFLRKGGSGDWKRFLNSQAIKRIEDTHGRVMRGLGYTKSDPIK